MPTSPTWTADLDAAVREAPRGGSVEDWKAHTEALLTRQPCVYRRNTQISALYAALYLRRPALFKWAGMAAFASHHIRLALWPLRLNADRSGEVDLPRAIGRWQALRVPDVDRIRRTNNGIFDDIFWAHIAYDGSADGLAELHRAIAGDDHYAAVGEAFERIERGRQQRDAGDPRGADAIWEANVALLEHEQRAVVQPNFDRLSCSFARVFSFGASAGFEVNGLRQAVAAFTSFYGHAARGRLRGRRWEYEVPLLTSFGDRWDWIEGAIVPRFRRFERDGRRAHRAFSRIAAEAG